MGAPQWAGGKQTQHGTLCWGQLIFNFAQSLMMLAPKVEKNIKHSLLHVGGPPNSNTFLKDEHLLRLWDHTALQLGLPHHLAVRVL